METKTDIRYDIVARQPIELHYIGSGEKFNTGDAIEQVHSKESLDNLLEVFKLYHDIQREQLDIYEVTIKYSYRKL